MIGLHVIRGEVIVGSIDQVLHERSVIVWHVDLESKYAEIVAYNSQQVILRAGASTAKIDESFRGRPTRLFTGLGDEWELIAESARYTCRVVAYRPDAGGGEADTG